LLSECPGKNLIAVEPEPSYSPTPSDHKHAQAALKDFALIFQYFREDVVMLMLSVFAKSLIDRGKWRSAKKEAEAEKRKKMTEEAFARFDALANCLNHIFEQFAVNQVVTRNGFVPRQDVAITASVYVPTLAVLADPRWKPVSDDLSSAFEDYRSKNYGESITKAHAAVQRFLQILVGEEGKNAKGEVKALLQDAKAKGLIPVNRFTEPLVNASHSFLASERATNSTAKPAVKEATPSDALLVLNTVMVFLQFCLQAT
jgi:hypothetical protein